MKRKLTEFKKSQNEIKTNSNEKSQTVTTPRWEHITNLHEWSL